MPTRKLILTSASWAILLALTPAVLNGQQAQPAAPAATAPATAAKPAPPPAPAPAPAGTSTAPATTAAKPTTVVPGTATVTTPGKPIVKPLVKTGIPPVKGIPRVAFSLRYLDIKIGTGELAKPHQIYTVNYTGWLKDGTKFDSSLDHGQPIQFPQGMHRIIPGWEEGFAGMKVGGKRRLYIPYQLAYGEMGHPPVIPPKSELIFDVELVAVKDMPAAPPPGTPGQPRTLPPGARPIVPGAPTATAPGSPSGAPAAKPATTPAPSATTAPAPHPQPAAPATPPPSSTPATPPPAAK